MNINNKEAYEVVKKSSAKINKALIISLISFFVIIIFYLTYQVSVISQKVAGINISDDKVDYVYNKIGDLVNILDTREDMSVDYNPTESYDFKPGEEAGELTADEPLNAQENSQALKEELGKMKDDEKLKVVRDKLVDIYQNSKTQDEELVKLKQLFYETKSQIETWFADKKGIKPVASAPASSDNSGLMNRLKNNLGHFVEINKVGEDLSKSGKKVLNTDQIPQMLSYAEMLLEAGSISQTVWIMEDIQTITKQEEIANYTAKADIYLKKYPNPNADMQGIKELVDIIENQE
jgi:hypothetical protein